MSRRFAILYPTQKSLARGTVLTLGSFWLSVKLTGFPDVHASLWVLVPLLLTCVATWDQTRCLQKRWSFYHVGVLLLIYVDLMVLLTIAFLLVLPYTNLLQR